MNTTAAKKKIKEAGGSWSVFEKWMYGQTVGYVNGEIDWYDYDVNRFIEYNCDPDNEPVEDFD
jgi:hypothetical protein